MSQINVTWHKCVRCLYNVSNVTPLCLLPLICDDLPVHFELYKHSTGLSLLFSKSNNSWVKFFFAVR